MTEPLEHIRPLLAEQIENLCVKNRVPGYVLGIARGNERLLHAFGIANVNTGVPMTADTAYLAGSITKIMTTTLLLRCVARGLVDLDAPATRALPEFKLNEPGLAEQISVRQLLNHTNGLDADSLRPTRAMGAPAVKSYVDMLAGCGLLFTPGANLHYSNPGMSVAGRTVEVLGGRPFYQALEEEIFAPAGMTRSCTSAKQAILHRTAVGSHPQADGSIKATTLFSLADSGTAAGATPIVTVEDLITLGQTMLNEGLAPNGARILDAGLARAMTQRTFDLGTPAAAPIGLGWWLTPIAGTTVWWHGGGTPGNTSIFVVIPEADIVIAGYGNGPASGAIHDAVVATVLKDLLGGRIEPLFAENPAGFDASKCVGSFASHQVRQTVEATADGLRVTTERVPMDEDHAAWMAAYNGAPLRPQTVELVAVGPALLKPKGMSNETASGLMGRHGLVAFNTPDADGRYRFSHSGFRSIRRVDGNAVSPATLLG